MSFAKDKRKSFHRWKSKGRKWSANRAARVKHQTLVVGVTHFQLEICRPTITSLAQNVVFLSCRFVKFKQFHFCQNRIVFRSENGRKSADARWLSLFLYARKVWVFLSRCCRHVDQQIVKGPRLYTQEGTTTSPPDFPNALHNEGPKVVVSMFRFAVNTMACLSFDKCFMMNLFLVHLFWILYVAKVKFRYFMFHDIVQK